MKASLKWLKEYVDITLPADELAAKLTASGTEVVGVIRIGQGWEGVQVAQITDVQPHPNADRLRLATVDLGGTQQTVVCGAPNIAVGQKVPYAGVGAKLIDGHTGEPMVLEAAKIRGVVSNGMLCSEFELGLSKDHEGILVLTDDSPLGTPLADLIGDTIIDMDVTPNRSDCFSVLGIARETAVLTNQGLREPDNHYSESGDSIQSKASIEIADSDLCPRYTATLITGIKLGPSPAWMQERLQSAGMRPINNVVDVTNYVMMELGQPLHAFDYNKLRDHKIIVRRARAGERMTTLDGVDRALEPDMLLICDGQGPVALGGVIGGQNSEVSDETTDILLESANFASSSIRRTASSLRIRTEASLRFEKGLNPESAEAGLRRATKLLAEICGGTVAQGVIDVYPEKRKPTSISLTPQKLRTILGTEIPEREVADLLTVLGCRVLVDGNSAMTVTPPWWRPDLRIPEDLAEEVARILGYDALPTTALRGALPHVAPDPIRALKESIRDTLVGIGMQEALTYSLTSLINLQKVGVVEHQLIKVTNPMSSEQEYLRTTLRANLLTTLAANERHSPAHLRLFEVGHVFWGRPDDLPDEREQVVGVLAGFREEPRWGESADMLDFYDAKGVIETLCRVLGADVEFRLGSDANLRPGRQASIVVGEDVVGVLGEVHPDVLGSFDIVSSPVYLFEFDLPALLTHVGDKRRFQPLPRFPAVSEDLAIIVDKNVQSADVERTLLESPLVVAARLFDVYDGPQVPDGMKSLAYSISYQAADHTLTGEETSSARQAVIVRLQAAHGARLRE